MTISETLAEYVADAAYDGLPATVIRAAKASLIDTLAVSIAGHAAPGVSAVIDAAIGEGGRSASAIWTRQERVPPRAAAFTNGFMASALDFDSLHQEAAAHADIVIVPTAVAVSEDRRASGKEMLTAITVGDDMLCRLGRSTRLNSGWFYTSVYGPIAGAAITAKLLGGGAAEIANAMGLGSMSAGGTQQPTVERTMGKRMQGALAAAASVTAGYLAKNGMDGPREIIEGPFGLYAMHEKGDPAVITQDLGRRFEGSQIGFKLYPSCQCNHAAIEGVLKLREQHGLSHENVRSVEVAVSPYMQRLVGAPFEPGGNPQVAAQFSIQYSIASVLFFGRLGVREISDQSVLDPHIAELVRRVSVVVDPDNHNNYAPVGLKVTTTEGKVIEQRVDTYRGSPEWPLSDADLKEKLGMCIDAAGRPAGAAKVDAAFDAVMDLESVREAAPFVSGLLARCLA